VLAREPGARHDPVMSEPHPPVALVTGAGKRIGRAIAIDLARHGWAVGVHHHCSSDDAAGTLAIIEAEGAHGCIVEADLADEAQSAGLMAQSSDALGPVTLLVNNASTFGRDEVDTVSRQSWDAHMEANLRAPFVLIQAMAAALPAERSGNVINLIDQRVWNLTPHFISYTLAKSGLWTLTRTLALALAPRIRVNAIGPGPTLPSSRQSEEEFARQWQSMPLGRGTTPEEICATVQFLLAAPAVTGQMIALDGGQHLNWAPGTAAGGDTE
jgi:NAD(P)-dependent dehydrogenase (short-subunit alcohol dehydrogenase family)